MTDLCAQFGIPIQKEAGCVHLGNVRLGSHVAALEEGAPSAIVGILRHPQYS